MSNFKPDSVYYINNLKINIKKIPFGTKWIKDCCGFKKGDLYKADRLMTNNTGKILGITIHNTGNSADAETYTRATFNQNMKTSRVHFYVDKNEVWQNLEENEVGWHAGTGDKSVGNDSYMAIEIIMGSQYSEEDKKAEENGALLTAYMMLKYGLSIGDIVTHNHWSGKYCPAYILPHWNKFLELVQSKIEMLVKSFEEDTKEDTNTSTQMPVSDAAMDSADNVPDDYAAYSVYKAVQNKILLGNPEGDLMLHSNVTRQELCVILDRIGALEGIRTTDN